MTTTSPTPKSERFSLAQISPRQRDMISLGILAVLVALAVPGLYRYQGPPMEEGFMLAFPEQILKGNLPHRDFLHLYGPGSLWLLAGVFKVFGVTLEAERSVGLLQHLGTTFGLFFLLKPFGRRIATSAAGLSFIILIGPAGLSALAWNGALALGLMSLATGAAAVHAPEDEATRKGIVLACISGVLAGAALLFRPDMVLAIGLGSVAMLVRLPKVRRIWMAAGGLAMVALYIPHVLLSGISDSFNGMFMEPVFKLRPGRTLPAPPSWGSIDGFLQRVGTLRTTGWPLPMLEQSHQIFIWFWLLPVSIVVVLVAGWRLRKNMPDSRMTTALWPSSLFVLALITQAFQRPDSTHLAWVSGISFPMMIPALYVLLSRSLPHSKPASQPDASQLDASELEGQEDDRGQPDGRQPDQALTADQLVGLSPLSRFSPRSARAMAMLVPVVILVVIVPFYPLRTYVDLVSQTFGLTTFGYSVDRDGRVFYLGDQSTAHDAQVIIDELSARSEPGQRLIVGPVDMSRTNYSDSYFYYLFPDLVAGTRYIEMDPGLADTSDSGLASEIEQADWLVLSDVWSGWTEPNESAEGRSQEANQAIESKFCPVVEAGLFELMKRCR